MTNLKRFNESLNPTPRRYEVRRSGTGEYLGIITANNLSHASTKALQLYRRHVYAVPA